MCHLCVQAGAAPGAPAAPGAAAPVAAMVPPMSAQPGFGMVSLVCSFFFFRELLSWEMVDKVKTLQSVLLILNTYIQPRGPQNSLSDLKCFWIEMFLRQDISFSLMSFVFLIFYQPPAGGPGAPMMQPMMGQPMMGQPMMRPAFAGAAAPGAPVTPNTLKQI